MPARFASLLQVLQSSEDFIDELVEVRQAEKALQVIRHLTQDIRDASMPEPTAMGWPLPYAWAWANLRHE